MAKKNRKTKGLPLHWRGSFEEYLKWAGQDSMAHLRTARQYLYDAILSFGKETVPIEETEEELTRYHLFTADLPHRKELPVRGMDRSLEILMRHLESRAMRMHDLPRMIVLNGPPGSSKSSTVERLKVALEEYSRTDRGACFTTTVLLPVKDDPAKKTQIGFLAEEKNEMVNGSYAHLPKDEIYAQITCPQHDSPLLWYPREVRKEKLEGLLAEAGLSMNDVEIPDELLYGELCPVCSQIQDHLMAEHDDDLEEVLKYVRVDRVRFKGDIAGLATVAPGTSHNLTALSLTQDPNYQMFTDRFPGIKLVELDGAFLKANRGLIHLEDFVKASRGDLNYLLRAISNGQLTTKDLRTGKEITVTVDEIILSTDNVEEIEALRKMGSKGLDSRVFVIDWPYVLEASEEEKIYIADFAERGCSKFTCIRTDLPHLAPHLRELAALYTVMTRYEMPDVSHFKHIEDFSDGAEKLIRSLTPFDKAQLYEGRVPERFTKEEAKLLTKQMWRTIRTEYPNEGIVGIGVRDMQEAVNLLDPAEGCTCIRPTDLFRVLEDFIKTDSFHYLNANSRSGYHDVEACLRFIRQEYHRAISREVKQALTNISPETMGEWMKEYVGLVAETYEAKFLGGPEGDGDLEDDELEKKLGEFEILLNLKDRYSKNKFRNEMRARVARYTEQLGSLEGYQRVFPELYRAVEKDRFEKVKDRFFNENDVKPELLEAVSKFDPAQPASTLSDELRKDLTRVFDTMRGFGYCTECARSTLIYALDNKLV